MRLLAVLVILVLLACSASQAMYLVRVSDLTRAPIPDNPIKVCGRVTSEAPLMITDGKGELEIAGMSAKLGDFLVLVGDYSAGVLTISGECYAYVGSSRTEMVYVPAGSFDMGNNGSEGYSYSNELPQHSVNLSGYFIGRHEVTRGEYRKFIDAGGYTNPAYWSALGLNWKDATGATEPYSWAGDQDWGTPPGPFTQSEDAPVVGVTFYEAEAYCNWAGLRLPTEAQWEKAARWNASASHANVYPWGDTWEPDKCNSFADILYPGYQTAPVGSYQAGLSPYGCRDMAGNVLEWVSDWFAGSYYSATPEGGWVDPQGPDSGTYRLMRGGSWNYTDNQCRSSYRHTTYPYLRWRYFGFRAAR